MVDKAATDRTGMVQVELSQEEWEQRAAALAAEEQGRFDLIEKKRTHNRKWNEELIQKRDTIRQLTEEVDTRKAWVASQTDMFGQATAANDDEAEEEPAEKPAAQRGGRRRRSRSAAAEETADA